MDPSDGRVVSNFIVQALNNQPLTLYGDGKQTRSFCYYEDLLEGLIKLMETESHITGPINLGNDDEYSMLELAKIIIELTNSKSEIVFKPLPSDDPRQRRPDLSLALKTLDYKPVTPLRLALEQTCDYFQKIL